MSLMTYIVSLLLLIFPLSLHAESLIGASDLVYVGAFRLPWGLLCGGSSWYADTIGAGGDAIAFNPAGNGGGGSLYVTTTPPVGKVVEVSIPSTIVKKPLSSPFSEKTELPEATLLQCPADITEGNRYKILDGGGVYGSGDVYIGGLMVWGNKLIGTVYEYYVGATQILSHFTSGLNLSTSGDFGGMYLMSNNFARAIGGYMCPIPAEHQAALGGKAISGQGSLTTISGTSSGPAMYSFNPDDLGSVSPAPVTTLSYYPLANALGSTESQFSPTTNMWNLSSTHPGIVFPNGKDTILMLGAQGLGEYCYGSGTSDMSLVGTLSCNGDKCCYDPVVEAHGGHFYPYESHVWAYSVSELAAVKSGSKAPYDARPYANWKLEVPFSNPRAKILSATYDSTLSRIYIAVADDDSRPIIHVFSVGEAAPPTPSSSFRPWAIGGRVIAPSGRPITQ